MSFNPFLSTISAVFGLSCCLVCGVRADDEADRAALRLIRTNYMEAVNSGNLSKVAPFLANDATGVMVTGQEVKGFEGLESYWKEMQNLIGPGGSYHVVVNVDKTDIQGDLAVSRGTTDDIVHLGSGKELKFNSFWSAVCRKQEGAWKVVRMQATMNPVDNVFVALQLQRAKIAWGAGGIIAGALLMSVIQILKRALRRRPSNAAA